MASRLRVMTVFLSSFSACLLGFDLSQSSAGLSAANSYITASPNGEFLFVMLGPEDVDYEIDDEAELPSGETVNLRTMFPSSGCYKAGSTKPQWTVDWYSYICLIGDDGRSIVRCNLFGDGDYPRGGQLSWGLKFYHSGKEIKEYSVAELVDYPVLMPFTSSDWHDDWLSDSDDNLLIVDGRLHVETSTYEEYIFDVATGALLREYRWARWVVRANLISWVVLLVLLVVWNFDLLRRDRQNEKSLDCSEATKPRLKLVAAAVVLSLAQGCLGYFLYYVRVMNWEGWWLRDIIFFFGPTWLAALIGTAAFYWFLPQAWSFAHRIVAAALISMLIATATAAVYFALAIHAYGI